MSKDFAKTFDDFKREMRLELRSVKESVKFCSDTCDEMKKITSEVKALRKELSELVKCNEGLRSENKRLTRQVEELQQYRRLNNLEVKGVKANAEPVDVIKKLVKLLANQSVN
ncbi:hypothetical protein HPB49_007578 [Dermacentor silvarum]|uniref:Uncharacterized protein n=1 Tax=Dermacentor silvarum TaxID=543639 RepID=A0ACB8DX65_DERSI|nr:hypothetical protein HPB49_007578 [Dermacentor silvarum]